MTNAIDLETPTSKNTKKRKVFTSILDDAARLQYVFTENYTRAQPISQTKDTSKKKKKKKPPEVVNL